MDRIHAGIMLKLATEPKGNAELKDSMLRSGVVHEKDVVLLCTRPEPFFQKPSP